MAELKLTRAFYFVGTVPTPQSLPAIAQQRQETPPQSATPAVPPLASLTAPVPTGPTVSGHRVGETFRDCSDVYFCPEMVVVPTGSFRMGSPGTEKGRSSDEAPVHEVQIRYAFSVSKYPITRLEWKQFVKKTGHKDDSDCLDGQQDNHPVVCVSWKDAQDYAAWLSRNTGHRYRLLSEAEYEYVNRAGSPTAYFWGDTEDELEGYTKWRRGVLLKATWPVGSFKGNAFGLYDTTGHVWSWTQDCYHNNYSGAPTDGNAWEKGGDCSQRVVRGGSWKNDSSFLWSASRLSRGDGSLNVGFRVARSD